MSPTPAPAKSTSKTTKKSKVIILRVSPDHLSRFPSAVVAKTPVPPPAETTPSIQPPQEPADKTSESNATPVPPTAPEGADANSLAPPKVDGRRKRGGAVAGRKRAPPSIDPNGPMRERGRPGPKKKPRLPDGTIDRSHDNGTKPSNPVPAHRLGPKANTGNINANLRALDRTGKPCRRWERKGLTIKSFTGAIWGTNSWKAPTRDNGFSGDVKSDTTGSSDLKPNESSAVASEHSNSGVGNGDARPMEGIESSPAPAPIAAS
ncbi:hypothetical protein B0A50_00877 [Salinomyces thailandicus]|uniref:Uncharacterized protein n=1 Tax=Salinomyces thailandicus TaxID=706561 RepID=A0A4U0UD75_9PEZI|nr:hypothetical protein B0A50_00877 [Salinomyces thailandica]